MESLVYVVAFFVVGGLLLLAGIRIGINMGVQQFKTRAYRQLVQTARDFPVSYAAQPDYLKVMNTSELARYCQGLTVASGMLRDLN